MDEKFPLGLSSPLNELEGTSSSNSVVYRTQLQFVLTEHN